MKRTKSKVVDIFEGSASPQALTAAHWRTTDIANSVAFVTAHGAGLRFSRLGGGWHRWRGGRWELDITDAVGALAQDTVTTWWKSVGTAGSPEEREILAKHFLATAKAQRIEAMLKLAGQDERIAVSPDAFDRDPDLFTVPNGTFDFGIGELRPHRPEDLITKRSPVKYNPDADCPRFREFLLLIFAGEQTLVDFIQRALGYSMTGHVSEQCLFFAYGTGCNGKSTLLNIVHAVMGEYGRVAAPGLLMQSKHEAHPTEIADLRGARFVSAVETEQDRRFAEVKLKWLTGGDKLKARMMRRDFFEFTPTHKFWLAGNYKPGVRGTDPAIWRRLLPVPFTVDLRKQLDGELIRDYAATFADEYEGVLRWMIDGALIWRSDGLRPPAIVLDAVEAYRAEQDQIGQWVEETCERDSRARIPFKTLYNAYAEEFRSDALTKPAFAHELDRLGIHNAPVGGVKFRAGIRLREAQQ